MYKLPYFSEKDQAALLEFIRQHPFALVAGCDENQRPVATQIPVFIEERQGKLCMSGHMMRNTDHHKAFVQNPQVLCIFTGPHAYVSASWYVNPHQASTWNYMSVHVKGRMNFLDEDSLVEVLKKTSLHFENNNANSPTSYDNLPESYRKPLLKAIVAFEVEVEEMENVFKLSQNRDEESYHHIIEKLEEQDSAAKDVAEEMKKRSATLFPNRD